MAVGDDAISEGYLVVPDSGEEGKVRWGAREINRTRDYVALLKKLIPSNTSSAQTRAGISYGSSGPSSSYGDNGDIYFRII